MTTILLIESDTTLCEVLRYHLTRESYIFIEAQSASGGIALARSHAPDLILLAMTLRDMPGMECCQILRSESSVPIVLLAERADGADGILGLDLGADDYVIKPLRLTEVLARLRSILRRSKAPPQAAALVGEHLHVQEVLQAEALRVYPASRRVFLGAQELQLGQKEFDLLVLLMRHRGWTVPRDLMLKQVWGHDHRDGIRTIDVHVRWLRQKIEANPAQPHYIHTVRGIGYRFTDA
jgi:DNA-binding response OmpR family regulator